MIPTIIYCILTLCATSISANEYCRITNDHHCHESIDSLSPIDFQFTAGVAPLIWKNSSTLRGVFSEPPPGFNTITNPVFFPSFSFFYKTPYTVGASFGYFPCDWLRLSVEGNYYHAQARKPKYTRLAASMAENGNTTTGVFLNFTMQNYHFYDVMVNVEYYSRCLFDSLLFHAGLSTGLTLHQKNYFSLSETIPGLSELLTLIPASNPTLFIKNSVTPTIGATMGLDYNLFSTLYLSGTVGFLACAGPKVNPILTVVSNLDMFPLPNLLLSSIETEIKFPCTLGLRYDF